MPSTKHGANQAQLEDENARLSGELERAHRLALLGTLAAGIAHEINNILTPSLSYLDIARKAMDDRDNVERALDSSALAIRRVAEISDAILDLGRGPSGNTFYVEPPRREICSVQGAVDQAMLCLGNTSAIHVEIEPALAAAIKPIALEQVLLNLLVNAREAIGTAGRIEIKAASHRRKGQRDWVTIEVLDNGRGISDAHLASIFDSFVTHSSKPGRSGLGLMVCQRLIEGAGGTISVQSRVDEGTTFRIELPSAASALQRSA